MIGLLGGIYTMNNLLELCKISQDKLGRGLNKKEIEFLKWLYETHQQEVKTTHQSDLEKLIVS